MATSTSEHFYFSDDGDPVPGTGPHIDTDKLREASDTSTPYDSAHNYAGGVDEILMPQSRMRQRALFNQTALDGGKDLSYVYPSCGATIDYCNDDFRYWPAFRDDVTDSAKINKFVINDGILCKRWASAPVGETSKQASDEGDWLGHTIDENYAMMNIANPGFDMSNSTDASAITLADYNSNYMNAFLGDYAPGWSSACVRKAAASFRASFGSAYDLSSWGFFENSSNQSERANIQYGGHYGEDICGGIFTFIPVATDFYVGGVDSTDSAPAASSDDTEAGDNWESPSSSNNWREPDICSEWPHYDPNPFVSIEGGIESISDRVNRTSHCFKCKNGRYFLNGSMVADSDEKCLSICEADYGGSTNPNIEDSSSYNQYYFINEGIFYDSSALYSEIQ